MASGSISRGVSSANTAASRSGASCEVAAVMPAGSARANVPAPTGPRSLRKCGRCCASAPLGAEQQERRQSPSGHAYACALAAVSWWAGIGARATNAKRIVRRRPSGRTGLNADYAAKTVGRRDTGAGSTALSSTLR